MIEFFLEIIIYFFVEIIFHGIILGAFELVRLIGLAFLKLITFSSKPIQELKTKYDDSSKPYFFGLGITSTWIYLIIKLTNWNEKENGEEQSIDVHHPYKTAHKAATLSKVL